MDERINEILKRNSYQDINTLLNEEIGELLQAKSKLDRCKGKSVSDINELSKLTNHLAEEITDVEIMLEQLKYKLSLVERCNWWKEYKLNRQMERMGLGGKE